MLTKGFGPHETSTCMLERPPAEVDAGADMAVGVQTSCSKACDLRGGIVRLMDHDGALAKEVELGEFDGAGNQTYAFVAKAPSEPGLYTWTAVFPAQKKEGVLHRGSSALFSFAVKPHSTSIAVWDVPSPVAVNDRFKVKVGVKCSAECNLVNEKIGIYGQKGKKVADGALGGLPWPGTSALYWVEVELEAPGVEGRYRWRARFLKPDLELPHEQATYHFGFTTASPPEHVVRVEVIDRDAKAPIRNASVLLRSLLYSGHVYRGRTDDGGVATIGVPKGDYQLYASGEGKESARSTVNVSSDMTIKAEVFVVKRVQFEDSGLA
jgi:hypothetical protein